MSFIGDLLPAAGLIGDLFDTGAKVNSGDQAADAQRYATDQANQTQRYFYDTTRQDNMPALGSRNAALSKMRDLLGIGTNPKSPGYGSLGGPVTVGDVTKDPGYQFGLNQGQGALNSQMNARGMRNSGAALMAASRYGNDYGTTKYGQAFDRVLAGRSAQLNPLQSLAGLGQSGAGAIASAGMNAGNAIGANQLSLGDSLGSSYIAQGNVLGNAAKQLGGWYANQKPPGTDYNSFRLDDPYRDRNYLGGTGGD